MICETKSIAERVAIAGAVKMDEQGYRYEIIGTMVQVNTPEGGRYFVQTDPELVAFMDGKFCDCPFAKENKQFGTCKHLVWAHRIMADEAYYNFEAQQFADWCDYRHAYDEKLVEMDIARQQNG